jgi:hypothetical protein
MGLIPPPSRLLSALSNLSEKELSLGRNREAVPDKDINCPECRVLAYAASDSASPPLRARSINDTLMFKVLKVLFNILF